MKRIMTVILLAGFLCLCSQSAASQEQKQEEKKEQKTEISTEIPQLSLPVYNPGGRRDPFRNLMVKTTGTGTETKTEAATAETVSQAPSSFESMRLIGIIKSGRQYTAIMVGEQEFPLYLRVGHKFPDGFILSIDDSKVVFRRLREGGAPLAKPRDIVKELIL